MFKGVLVLVFALCLVASSEAGWGHKFKSFAKKGLSFAKKAGSKALEGAAQGALNSVMGDADSLEELQNMTPDEYDQMMMDVADQLGEIFQPDAVNKITDHMDMAINSEDYMDY